MKKRFTELKALFIRGHQQGNYPANKETDMTKNLTELAEAAIDALKAFNAEYRHQKRLWEVSRYGKHFAYNSAYISDEQHIELLTEIIEYDEDPAGTLQELVWQSECDHSDDEADYRYEEMRSRELMENS